MKSPEKMFVYASPATDDPSFYRTISQQTILSNIAGHGGARSVDYDGGLRTPIMHDDLMEITGEDLFSSSAPDLLASNFSDYVGMEIAETETIVQEQSQLNDTHIKQDRRGSLLSLGENKPSSYGSSIEQFHEREMEMPPVLFPETPASTSNVMQQQIQSFTPLISADSLEKMTMVVSGKDALTINDDTFKQRNLKNTQSNDSSNKQTTNTVETPIKKKRCYYKKKGVASGVRLTSKMSRAIGNWLEANIAANEWLRQRTPAELLDMAEHWLKTGSFAIVRQPSLTSAYYQNDSMETTPIVANRTTDNSQKQMMMRNSHLSHSLPASVDPHQSTGSIHHQFANGSRETMSMPQSIASSLQPGTPYDSSVVQNSAVINEETGNLCKHMPMKKISLENYQSTLSQCKNFSWNRFDERRNSSEFALPQTSTLKSQQIIPTISVNEHSEHEPASIASTTASENNFSSVRASHGIDARNEHKKHTTTTTTTIPTTHSHNYDHHHSPFNTANHYPSGHQYGNYHYYPHTMMNEKQQQNYYYYRQQEHNSSANNYYYGYDWNYNWQVGPSSITQIDKTNSNVLPHNYYHQQQQQQNLPQNQQQQSVLLTPPTSTEVSPQPQTSCYAPNFPITAGVRHLPSVSGTNNAFTEASTIKFNNNINYNNKIGANNGKSVIPIIVMTKNAAKKSQNGHKRSKNKEKEISPISDLASIRAPSSMLTTIDSVHSVSEEAGAVDGTARSSWSTPSTENCAWHKPSSCSEMSMENRSKSGAPKDSALYNLIVDAMNTVNNYESQHLQQRNEHSPQECSTKSSRRQSLKGSNENITVEQFEAGTEQTNIVSIPTTPATKQVTNPMSQLSQSCASAASKPDGNEDIGSGNEKRKAPRFVPVNSAKISQLGGASASIMETPTREQMIKCQPSKNNNLTTKDALKQCIQGKMPSTATIVELSTDDEGHEEEKEEAIQDNKKMDAETKTNGNMETVVKPKQQRRRRANAKQIKQQQRNVVCCAVCGHENPDTIPVTICRSSDKIPSKTAISATQSFFVVIQLQQQNSLCCTDCATFFRETVLNLVSYECRQGNGLCKVFPRADKQHQLEPSGSSSSGCCEACLFDRCVLVGMSARGEVFPSSGTAEENNGSGIIDGGVPGKASWQNVAQLDAAIERRRQALLQAMQRRGQQQPFLANSATKNVSKHASPNVVDGGCGNESCAQADVIKKVGKTRGRKLKIASLATKNQSNIATPSNLCKSFNTNGNINSRLTSGGITSSAIPSIGDPLEIGIIRSLMQVDEQWTQVRTTPGIRDYCYTMFLNKTVTDLLLQGTSQLLGDIANIKNITAYSEKEQQHQVDKQTALISPYHFYLELFLAFELAQSFPIICLLDLDDREQHLKFVAVAHFKLSMGYSSAAQQCDMITYPDGHQPHQWWVHMAQTSANSFLVESVKSFSFVNVQWTQEEFIELYKDAERVNCELVRVFTELRVSHIEFVLLRALLFSCGSRGGARTPGLSQSARLLLDIEWQKYSRVLRNHLQRELGAEDAAERRHAQLLALLDYVISMADLFKKISTSVQRAVVATKSFDKNGSLMTPPLSATPTAAISTPEDKNNNSWNTNNINDGVYDCFSSAIDRRACPSFVHSCLNFIVHDEASGFTDKNASNFLINSRMG